MDELDNELKKYYTLIRSKDDASTPDFDELIPLPFSKREKWIPLYLKVAASLLFAALVTGYYLRTLQKDEAPIAPYTVSENLMQQPEYLWEWQSPTRNLLVPNELE